MFGTAFWKGFREGCRDLLGLFAYIWAPNHDAYSIEDAFAEVDGYVREAMTLFEAQHGPLAALQVSTDRRGAAVVSSRRAATG